MPNDLITLIADSGSTKTDWLLRQDNAVIARCQTQGFNPFMRPAADIAAAIRAELLTDIRFSAPDEIRFFGAGCRAEGCTVMEGALRTVWPAARSIEVASDLIGAARALCGRSDGIACILGTGSNSGLYLGGRLVKNVSPLGYILGDEGSGATLGRRLLGDVLKCQLPAAVCEDFNAAYNLTPDDIIRRVYREPSANRFLASFAPFLARHRTDTAVRELLIDEFSRFFIRNVAAYSRPDLPVSFAGSIAHFFAPELRQAAALQGFTVGQTLRSPLDAFAKM